MLGRWNTKWGSFLIPNAERGLPLRRLPRPGLVTICPNDSAKAASGRGSVPAERRGVAPAAPPRLGFDAFVRRDQQ